MAIETRSAPSIHDMKIRSVVNINIEYVSSTPHYMVRDLVSIQIAMRLSSLALLREFQVNGQTDIVTLRKRLRPTKDSEFRMRGDLQRYQKANGITGEVAGIDAATGFQYKRWTVTDVAAMKLAVKQRQLPLMPLIGKQRIEKLTIGGAE